MCIGLFFFFFYNFKKKNHLISKFRNSMCDENREGKMGRIELSGNFWMLLSFRKILNGKMRGGEGRGGKDIDGKLEIR